MFPSELKSLGRIPATARMVWSKSTLGLGIAEASGARTLELQNYIIFGC